MSQWLKQSTIVTIQLGPFLDEDDGKTAEAGLAIAQADVQLSKNGAAFAQKNDVNAAAHDAGGWYRCQINATDTNTLGRLIVAVHESGALPVWREFMVVPANEYDSMIAGSDALEVDAVLVEGGDATDALDTAVAAILTDTNELQTDWVDGGRLDLLIDAIKAVTDALPDAGALNDLALILADTNALPDNGALNDLATILTDTGELQTDWVDGGRLDLLIDAIKAVTDALPNAGALNDLATILTDTGELQTDWVDGGRLDLILDAASAPTAAQVADAVWDELVAGHDGAGKAGQQLWTDVDAILADTNELQVDDTPAAIAALPTAIENADAVLSRGVANVEDAADTTSLAAVILATLESAVVGAVWTIRKTGGAAFVVKTVTLDAGGLPIIGVT